MRKPLPFRRVIDGRRKLIADMYQFTKDGKPTVDGVLIYVRLLEDPKHIAALAQWLSKAAEFMKDRKQL